MTDRDPIVRIGDVQKLGYCIATVKPWFDKHGLNWRDFVRNGIRASALREAQGPDGDLHMERTIEAAIAREDANG